MNTASSTRCGRLLDREKSSFIQAQMADKKLIIADGHHRYETALAYRDEMHGEKGSDRIPMTFFNMHSPGLTILPTHRVLSNLPGFDAEDLIQARRGVFRVFEGRTSDDWGLCRAASYLSSFKPGAGSCGRLCRICPKSSGSTS